MPVSSAKEDKNYCLILGQNDYKVKYLELAKIFFLVFHVNVLDYSQSDQTA